MAAWEKDELRRIAEADDLHISPFREDGVTYGTPMRGVNLCLLKIRFLLPPLMLRATVDTLLGDDVRRLLTPAVRPRVGTLTRRATA
jgi:hypothetical protein